MIRGLQERFTTHDFQRGVETVHHGYGASHDGAHLPSPVSGLHGVGHARNGIVIHSHTVIVAKATQLVHTCHTSIGLILVVPVRYWHVLSSCVGGWGRLPGLGLFPSPFVKFSFFEFLESSCNRVFKRLSRSSLTLVPVWGCSTLLDPFTCVSRACRAYGVDCVHGAVCFRCRSLLPSVLCFRLPRAFACSMLFHTCGCDSVTKRDSASLFSIFLYISFNNLLYILLGVWEALRE